MTDTRQPHEQEPRFGSAQAPTNAANGYEAPAGMPPGGYYPSSGPQSSAYGQWVPQQPGQWSHQSGQWSVPQGPWGEQRGLSVSLSLRRRMGSRCRR